MRKSSLFAVAATLIATGFGVWAASTTTDARVAELSLARTLNRLSPTKH